MFPFYKANMSTEHKYILMTNDMEAYIATIDSEELAAKPEGWRMKDGFYYQVGEPYDTKEQAQNGIRLLAKNRLEDHLHRKARRRKRK